MKKILFILAVPAFLFALVLPSQLVNNDISERLENVKQVSIDNTKWLFVIGVEEYDSIDPVAYASNSAKTFVTVMQKTQGISERNSYILIDDRATSGRIKSDMAKLLENVKEGDTIYFYYSGHGIPVIPSKDPYILPKDMTPAIVGLEEDFKLENIYKKLASSNAAKVIAIVDSCFSGSTDGKSLFKGVAASRLVAKKTKVDEAKMVVVTAGGGEEFSNMYKSKEHRLFSYFVMDALIDGKTDIESMYKSTFKNVKDVSFKMGDQFIQRPTIEGNSKLSF